MGRHGDSRGLREQLDRAAVLSVNRKPAQRAPVHLVDATEVERARRAARELLVARAVCQPQGLGLLFPRLGTAKGRK